jgi:hypothetical protein
VAEYNEKEAVKIYIHYAKRHHVIVLALESKRSQAVRLLGADDLRVFER